ncbi:hypothetical protein ACIPSA_44340 [Streptomyces sp. NPDC086549]|uniref:hypothetical protein n=1 Tax=Streptomyces sp. NPDC086549 TaxID=3365752 RepID=UPI0037F72288
MKRTRVRGALASAVMTALLTAVGAAPAQATPPTANACVFEGVNLNEFLGVRERLIGPPPCREAFVGEKWVRTFPSWGTAPSAVGAVYPPGYVPSRPNPMDDFVSKFQGVRIVQDIGTRQEWSAVFGPKTLRRFSTQDGLIFASFASGVLRPLSAGTHTTTVFMRLKAEHCDGLGTDPALNCLPAGEFQYTGDTPVTFLPRHP